MTRTLDISLILAVLGAGACYSPNISPGSDETDTETGDTDGTQSEAGSGTSGGGTTDSQGSSSTATEDGTTSSDTHASSEAESGEGESTGVGVCGDGFQGPDEECDEGEATITCSEDCHACEPPPPTAVTDQELGVCTASSGCGGGWITKTLSSVAQGFEVSQHGVLDSVSLNMRNMAADTSELTLQIVDAGTDVLLPSGLVPSELEEYVVASATVVGQGDWVWETLDFSDQEIELDPEHTYYLWLRMFPPYPEDDARGDWSSWVDVDGVDDPYPAGRSYFCMPANAEYPNGQPCQVELPSRDYAFRVDLVPDPPLCTAGA